MELAKKRKNSHNYRAYSRKVLIYAAFSDSLARDKLVANFFSYLNSL